MADNNAPIRILDRNSILSMTGRTVEFVEVPEWGGGVHVRSLTGYERDRFEASLQATKTGDTRANLSNFRSKLVVLAASDAEGSSIFSDTDITALGKTSAAALERVFSVAQRLAGMSKQDVEDLTGNSDAETESFDSD